MKLKPNSIDFLNTLLNYCIFCDPDIFNFQETKHFLNFA
jgi:hypothetical protein